MAMSKEEAESVYRDCEEDWARTRYGMIHDLCTMTHFTRDEIEESLKEARKEWAISLLMNEPITRP